MGVQKSYSYNMGDFVLRILASYISIKNLTNFDWNRTTTERVVGGQWSYAYVIGDFI